MSFLFVEKFTFCSESRDLHAALLMTGNCTDVSMTPCIINHSVKYSSISKTTHVPKTLKA